MFKRCFRGFNAALWLIPKVGRPAVATTEPRRWPNASTEPSCSGIGHPEGFGLPIAEAMAAGCWVVYSGGGGQELFVLALLNRCPLAIGPALLLRLSTPLLSSRSPRKRTACNVRPWPSRRCTALSRSALLRRRGSGLVRHSRSGVSLLLQRFEYRMGSPFPLRPPDVTAMTSLRLKRFCVVHG